MDEATADAYVLDLMGTATVEVDESEKSETLDAKNCLRHLLLHEFEVTREVRHGGIDRRERTKINVSQACENYLKPGAYDLDEVAAVLKKNGLLIKPYNGRACLLVAPPHPKVKEIYRGTSWRDPRETLKREGADGQPTTALSFGGRQFKYKALSFPLENLIEAA